jgi:hypothetical protein
MIRRELLFVGHSQYQAKGAMLVNSGVDGTSSLSWLSVDNRVYLGRSWQMPLRRISSEMLKTLLHDADDKAF